jgi:hypothetical protein
MASNTVALSASLFCAFLAASAAAADDPPVRKSPADPVILRSARLELILDRHDGLPFEYRMAWNNAHIHGEDAGRQIAVTLFRQSPRVFQKVSVQPAAVKASATQADFQFQVNQDGKPAASFTVRYLLDNATLYVSLENVQEKPGFELIEVALPDLATVREEDGPAWLAHGDGGGSTVTLQHATAGRLAPNRFWGGVAATLPVIMIGTAKAICVQETKAFMDTTELAVEGDAGHRRAEAGTIQVYRINGSLSQDMNLGPNMPRVPGNNKTPNLLVGQRSLCRLDFIGDQDGDGTLDWLDGAKLVRARMPPIPTHYYDDKFMYMIHSDEPKYPKPGATFEQSEKIVRQMATLTAFTPQDVYLWGWQYRGKDTGYPAVAEVNQRLGGYDALQKLIGEARKWNANVSFSDNFDDAYQSSPAWDTAMIARRPDGELWKSRNWTGEDSYIIGLAKYMAGPGPARIRYTCERYRLRDTYLVDVLSYYPIRNDWDPEHPASGIKNLIDGRYKVLDEFKKCGLDLVSEELRYAFVGKISVADNGPVGEKCPFGGEAIPLAATIYRRSAIWGLRGSVKRENSILHSLFYNGHGFPWLTVDTNLEDFVSFFYETIVPWYQVHYRNIESFRRDGERTVIGLEGNSTVDIDWKTNEYSVTVDGVGIAKNGDTFCPLGNDRILFYSKTGNQLSAPLPVGWNPKHMAAFALFADHTEAVTPSQQNGRITIDVPARRAVVVFRDGAAGQKLIQNGG